MCFANIYFFLDVTAKQWYINNEDNLNWWETFKTGLSALFGDCQEYPRNVNEQLKSRAQRSGEVRSHTFKVSWGCAKNVKWCNYIEDVKQKRIERRKFERLSNVVPVAAEEDEPDLVSLIQRIVQEEVHRVIDQTGEPLHYSNPYPQSQLIEEIVQDDVEKALTPVSVKLSETQRRPTYADVARKSRVLAQRLPTQPRKTYLWRTVDNRPVCFHCGRPGHVIRYYRERKAIFDSYRNRRQSFDEIDAEEGTRRPHFIPRSTPSPTRYRSPTRRLRSPSPYRQPNRSPCRRNEEN
ncbi:CCHC-type domain-containing protein [Trichonephila inaurata madagascariensis]|uniref:CCHC-type domain-containing protein n=1 Tax=Trichonephila inaurata madagascariensis TaxID=2747483 RepID=A0A8X6ID83_9ARAC|nr:CCHC-type domain-containing protein [Trichonephila inaurata madagascariensis]